jgi:DNA-binding CsgD family transcriptional regulator/PAS domain-containing protein
MTATRDPLRDLVATIYDAALEPTLWPQVAVGTAKALQAPHARLGVVDRQRGGVIIDAPSKDLSEPQLSMVRYQTPQSNPGLAFSTLTPPATVELRERRFSDRNLERSDYYNEIMRPFDLWHAAVVNVHRDEAVLAPMGVLRTRKDRPFGQGEVRSLRRLAPHLNRALRVTLRLREMEARALGLAAINDRALVALVLTDAYGHVAEANSLARAILAEGDGLAIRDGVLRAARSDDHGRLVRLILEAAGGVDGLTFIRKSGVMQVARPSCRRPLALVVSSTRNDASPFGRSRAVTIAFADPERAPEADRDLLARLYGFTAREAAVAALLLHGRSPSEAANELAMSENTIRTHIRHAFDKTHVERLADLVRTLLQGPGVRGR